MGNCCYDDSRINSYLDDLPKTQRQFKLQPLSASMRNSFVVNELRNLPPISKHIQNRMEELGPFIDKELKDFGSIYKLKNMSVYQGHLKVQKGQHRIINFQVPVDSFWGTDQLSNQSLKMGSQKIKPEFSRQMVIIFLEQLFLVTIKNMELCRKKGQNMKVKCLTKNLTGLARTYDNGKKVEGLLEWNIDQPQNKQSYKGSFKDNLLDGNGVLINSHGKYTGTFQKGVKSGFGVLEEPNGEKYEGSFLKGKKEGQGKVFNRNGSIKLEGKWSNGKFIQCP